MEEKKYSIVSKVKIGTDEYRDLIEGKLNAEVARDKYMRDIWSKDEEIRKLKEANLNLKKELDKLKSVMKQGTSREDITSIIMEIFGEN